jgi:hypothetical protein
MVFGKFVMLYTTVCAGVKISGDRGREEDKVRGNNKETGSGEPVVVVF